MKNVSSLIRSLKFDSVILSLHDFLKYYNVLYLIVPFWYASAAYRTQIVN